MLSLFLLAFLQGGADLHNARGTEAFKAGRVAESIREFDKAIAAEPRLAPHHWQRGISLYYAGKFDECRKQFESHKTVNPEDVENAVWHYLCVARVSGVETARKGLIPIQADERIPMMEVYAMYRGESTPEKVFAKAREGSPAEKELHVRLFYSHLYIGLFQEAAGGRKEAARNIGIAEKKYPVGHYMWDVARIHNRLVK